MNTISSGELVWNVAMIMNSASAVSIQRLDMRNEFLWHTVQREVAPKNCTIYWARSHLQIKKERNRWSREHTICRKVKYLVNATPTGTWTGFISTHKLFADTRQLENKVQKQFGCNGCRNKSCDCYMIICHLSGKSMVSPIHTSPSVSALLPLTLEKDGDNLSGPEAPYILGNPIP